MESPIEFHSQKSDTGVEHSCGLGCANENPGNGSSRCRGLLFHELIILYPLQYVNKKILEILQGVQYYAGMRTKRKLPASIKEFFVEMGRIGGKKGVKARMQKVNPARRKEIAQKAIAARWAKREEKG